MKCGHAANATQKNGDPCCVICVGIDKGATVIAETPDLKGREAKCGCKKIVSSGTNLAFFEHLPDKEYDRYYYGHGGWN